MSSTECPICMDAIDASKNSVVTDCGHSFHCSCLMKNAAHNGFGCPYCRTTMAEEPLVEDEDEYEDDVFSEDEENTEISDYALTSFRMFQQQIEGQELEDEPEEPEEESDEDTDYDNPCPMPSATYMTSKLIERGLTFEDLVKHILFMDHGDTEEYYDEYERHSRQVYGKFKAIISHYERY